MLPQRGYLAALVGGVVLFLWGAFSHIVLPFYNNSLNRFTNEDEILRAIASNVSVSGTYLIPNLPSLPPNASAEQKDGARREMQEKMKQGPLMYAHVRAGALESITGYYIVQVVMDLLAAVVIALLLWNSGAAALKSRVMISSGIGVMAILTIALPEWNWYGAGLDYVVAEAIDQIVGLGITGFVVGKMLPAASPKTM